jgi:hypothetical protein
LLSRSSLTLSRVYIREPQLTLLVHPSTPGSSRRQGREGKVRAVAVAVAALAPAEGSNEPIKMNRRDLAAGLDAVVSTASLAKPATVAAGTGIGAVRHHAANAVASTVSLAKPATVAAGLGHVKHHAASAVASAVSLANPATVAAGLGHVKCHAAAAVSTREGAAKAAAVFLGGAVGAYFLWPVAAAAPAVAGATMKAPGAAGFVISRAAFLGNPQLYFKILHTAGAAAAAAAFM